MLRLNNYTKIYVLSGEDRTIRLFGYTFDGFHFMQNQIKPKILSPVRLCILIIISILGHPALKLHNSASKTRMLSVTKHLQEMH